MVVGAGVARGLALDAAVPPFGDAARLRRMDRFGRAGFLAGSLALVDAGRVPGAAADPRAGIVFGTAYGCRDSITEHARLLRQTTQADELSPSTFAETVHNTVAGELSIDWRLGGVSEVLVSGRTAGLEAILRAAARIEDREADLIVAGAAEGMNARMREAWTEERQRHGPRGAELPCLEAGAALVLSRAETPGAAMGEIAGGALFFEPDAGLVAPRLSELVSSLFDRGSALRIVVASPDLDGALEPAALGVAGLGAAAVTGPARQESFAASGPLAIVELLRAGAAALALVVVRDPEGPTAAVMLRVTPRSA